MVVAAILTFEEVILFVYQLTDYEHIQWICCDHDLEHIYVI